MTHSFLVRRQSDRGVCSARELDRRAGRGTEGPALSSGGRQPTHHPPLGAAPMSRPIVTEVRGGRDPGDFTGANGIITWISNYFAAHLIDEIADAAAAFIMFTRGTDNPATIPTTRGRSSDGAVLSVRRVCYLAAMAKQPKKPRWQIKSGTRGVCVGSPMRSAAVTGRRSDGRRQRIESSSSTIGRQPRPSSPASRAAPPTRDFEKASDARQGNPAWRRQ